MAQYRNLHHAYKSFPLCVYGSQGFQSIINTTGRSSSSSTCNSSWGSVWTTSSGTSISDHWMGGDLLDYEEAEKQTPALHKMSSKHLHLYNYTLLHSCIACALKHKGCEEKRSMTYPNPAYGTTTDSKPAAAPGTESQMYSQEEGNRRQTHNIINRTDNQRKMK